MKLTTWNLAGGDKNEVVDRLESDILLLQERRRRDLREGELWDGTLDSKGLGVRANAELTVRRVPGAESLPRFFVPYQVEGLEQFQLIHVWAQDGGSDRYVRGIVRAAELWSDHIAAQPTVIAGDFNANRCWDAGYPRDRNFSALVKILEGLGLVSAYHAFYDEKFGAEARPTFFMYRRLDKPFHIDYCFVPKNWLPRLRSVAVGGHAEWGALSDHMPLSVEFT